MFVRTMRSLLMLTFAQISNKFWHPLRGGYSFLLRSSYFLPPPPTSIGSILTPFLILPAPALALPVPHIRPHALAARARLRQRDQV
ncbi:hypothetical protein C8J57DRAFT_1273579 [Mycena rebaudengoi]|nr:hypothetical protein C8J57DRAFT_1273579 [Mycena rebaudengoi]